MQQQNRMLVNRADPKVQQKVWFWELEERSPMTKQKSLVVLQVDPGVSRILNDNRVSGKINLQLRGSHGNSRQFTMKCKGGRDEIEI